MDWRKWLEEMEERAQLLEREAYTVPDAVEARCMVHSHSLPRLFEGYRLLAEAVEACAHLEKVREEADWDGLNIPPDVLEAEEGLQKTLDAALSHLRGVGRE